MGEFGSCATYPDANRPSIRWQGWLVELEPGSNLTAASSGNALLAATAPARAPRSRERRRDQNKRGGRKSRELPAKTVQQKSTGLPNPIFFISLNKMFCVSHKSLEMVTLFFPLRLLGLKVETWKNSLLHLVSCKVKILSDKAKTCHRSEFWDWAFMWWALKYCHCNCCFPPKFC